MTSSARVRASFAALNSLETSSGKRDVLADGAVGQQAKCWNTMPILWRRNSIISRSLARARSWPSMKTSPTVGSIRPGKAAHEGRLARTAQSHDDEDLAAGHVEGSVSHRRDVAAGLDRLGRGVAVMLPEQGAAARTVELPDAAGRKSLRRAIVPPRQGDRR